MIMDVAGKPQLISANVPAGAVVVTQASVSTKRGGSSPSSVTRKIQGAQDPQSSSGGGDFSLLILAVLGLLGRHRRLAR
jgi:MYXO-CTERM domain-containing protein